MASLPDWKLPLAAQPKPEDWEFDLDRVLSAVVGLRAVVPDDAFTAEILGTERLGNGVIIREDGIVLTIGYLITEAESIWLHLNDGRVVPGDVLAYDQVTGFGLVQALQPLGVPALPLGNSDAVRAGELCIMAAGGGRTHSLSTRVATKQEFAGYWEYLLDEAIFTLPAHPHWGGAALIGPDGTLLGIGSLHVEGTSGGDRSLPLNMVVPIDLLKPILDDALTLGQPNRPPRPWLGLYATEIDHKVVVMGLSPNGPADQANLAVEDILLAVGGRAVASLASFYRRVWALGPAGVEVPVTIHRDGDTFEARIISADRNRFLKRRRLH